MRPLAFSIRLALSVVFALLLLVTRSSAQILESANDSMTTYRPSGSSTIQGVRPQVAQRGVTLDGAMRSAPGYPVVLAGNPFENAWVGRENYAGIRIDTGSYAPQDIDISLPSKGIPWVVGRTYNAIQKNSGGTNINSNGYQGKNWFQTSQPEILLYDDADNTKDMVYLIYGADRYAEYVRKTSTSNQYKGRNGGAGVFDFQSGSPDVWVLTDQNGNEWRFFGFNTTSHATDGQFWKVTDPDGNVAFVGDSSTASTAITNGYSGGKITTAYDASDRRYSYTYTTLDSVSRLTQVKAETKTGGTWASSPTGVATAVQVDYTYYSSETHGDIGDLKQVKITTRLNDSAGETDQQIKRKYYRYWEGSADDTANYNSSTNPGYPHALKYVYDFEGIRIYDWLDSTFDEDHLTETDANLASYASAYFEYDSSHRVNKAYFEGQCGCGGGSNGTFQYTYETNGSYTDNSGYDQTWSKRTVVKRPDTSYLTQYFDEIGQGLSQVATDIDPATSSPTPKKWVTYVERNTAGRVTDVHTPENVTAYTHNSGGNPSGSITTSTSVGLVNTFVRAGSGAMTGFINSWKHQLGDPGSPTAYFTGSQTFTALTKTITDASVARPLIASTTEYTQEVTSGSTGANETDYTYTDYSSDSLPLTIKTITTTNPVVSTGNNGSGSATSSAVHFRKDSLRDFKKNEDATIEYWEYTNGQVSKRILDADTTKTSSGQDFYGVTIPSGFSSSGSPLHMVTTTTYTSQGFKLLESPPENGNLTYMSRLADHRLVVLNYADFDGSGTPTYYGPIRYSIRNQAGKEEAGGVVKLSAASTTSGQDNHVDESQSDPIAALAIGTVAQMRTSIYSNTGTELQQSRVYFSIPGSGAGTEGTHYDATRFAYDDSGRRIRTKDVSGTIRRSSYDLFGRVSDTSIGTNDHGLSGGESSGTSNMVTMKTRTFDGGSDGLNGNLTTVAHYKDATNHDDTGYSYDYRGRRVLETPPLAPFTVHKYDTAGREIAVGRYSSSSGLTTSSDPTSTSTNRLALAEKLFDEMGRAWEELRHKITQSNGVDADNLATLNWYDERGRVIKTDGNELRKIKYDRVGRVTDEYMLAKDNDASYTDVYDSTNHVVDVGGDIVLEQRETRYDPATGTALLQCKIERFHSDYGSGETTGALDTEADGLPLKLTASNIKGRVQITASWYDSLERIENKVRYGTNGGSDFDRSGLSVPSRSDSALRTTWAYDYDGTNETITDPRALVTKYLYDAEGRIMSEIKNYDPGVNSGNPYGTDQNVTVSYTYAHGMRTSVTKVMPNPIDNQVTSFIYGSNLGTPSQMKIATGHLLRAVKHPDSTNGGTTAANIDSDPSDVISYAYDAQSQEVYKRNQGDSVIETDYDGDGRETQERVTTLGSGVDGAVRRIATSYDGLGRSSTVDQYDNATVGSGSAVDGIRYTYDDWGPVASYEEDRDSTVSGGGNQYVTSYTYDKATTGRNTVRRTSMTMPGGRVIDYQYRTVPGLHDGEVSRVTYVVDHASSVGLAAYDYNGVGNVVGTQYPEADVMWNMYGSTGSYPDLDAFNRVVKSRWTKDLTTDVDFYHVELTYDRDSNIVSVDDQIHAGFDVAYTMDNMNRIARAEEGTLVSGSISSRTRDEQWTLSHSGNWDYDKVDLNGDDNFSDVGELNDHRTHDKVNQLNARDTDNDSTDNYALAYDGPGDMTDDGRDYTFVYDAFFRLRQIKNRSSPYDLIAEYRYNGLGHRIGIHEETDGNPPVNSSDRWFYDAFDEGWRLLARFRESDSSVKEDYVPHQAGIDGDGRSSYLNAVVCRNRDANTAWTSASDGVLEERIYYGANWRDDVGVIVTSGGAMKEEVRYSTYGTPYGLPAGDADSSGGCGATDVSSIHSHAQLYPPPYDVREDLDLDGIVTSTDEAMASAMNGTTLGRGVLSAAAVSSRLGFGEYQFTPTATYHVRLRELSTSLGRWGRREPLNVQYFGGLYEYVSGAPIRLGDPFGASPEIQRGCKMKADGYNTACAFEYPIPKGIRIPGATYPWLLYSAVDFHNEFRVYATGTLSGTGVCGSSNCNYDLSFQLQPRLQRTPQEDPKAISCDGTNSFPNAAQADILYEFWHGVKVNCLRHPDDRPASTLPTWDVGNSQCADGSSECTFYYASSAHPVLHSLPLACDGVNPNQDAAAGGLFGDWRVIAANNTTFISLGNPQCSCSCGIVPR